MPAEAGAAPGASGSPAQERTLTLVRTVAAPRATVFRAWTDPAHLALWWGPHGFTNPVCEVEARKGGRLFIVMHAPDGRANPLKGEFLEVEEPERLVFAAGPVRADGTRQIDGVTTVVLEEQDGGTKLTLHTRAVGLVPEAAAMLDGMEPGWNQSLDRLADQAEGVADRTLVITRMFDAPRALVWQAWTDPEHARHWMGPRGFRGELLETDFRPGGKWRAILRPEDGGRPLVHGGVVREAVPPERLVYTFAWEQEDKSSGPETLVTVTFAERGGKTLMTFRQAVFNTTENRDGHRQGWSSAFERLAEYVSSASGAEANATEANGRGA